MYDTKKLYQMMEKSHITLNLKNTFTRCSLINCVVTVLLAVVNGDYNVTVQSLCSHRVVTVQCR